jgi:protein TonB
MDSEKDENEYGESPKYVFVDKDESTQDMDDDSLMDKLSVFLSNSKNIVILIILVVAIFLSYAIFGGGITNNSNTDIISSSSSEDVDEPQSFDLGLSVEWASFNIGARYPYETGDYYWWASANPIKNESDAQIPFDWDETGQSFKKYNNLGMLISPEDDVAHKTLGGGWRVPTPDELNELVTKCTWEEAEYMDMKGYNVIGNNGNKIFLPYVGNPENAYWMGSYMSNSMSPNNVAYFYSLVFSDKTMKEIGLIDEKVKICVMEVARNSAAVVRPVKDKDQVYYVVEVMPEYPGGQDALFSYLSHNIKYPEEAERKGIEGKVTLTFIVEKDGSISEVEVVKPVNPLLDNEAVRVIKSMKGWIPGKQNGKTVRVKYTIPVTFRL